MSDRIPIVRDWPPVMDVDTATEYVGNLSVGSFRRYVAAEVPPIRLTPKRVGWSRDDLDTWLAKKRGLAATSAPSANPWTSALHGSG